MSEKSLDKLIETIKTEAIDAAEEKANAIIQTAEAKAKTIVENAEKRQTEIVSKSQKEAEQILAKGENALRQAARDVKLSLRNEVLALLKAVLHRDIDENFTPELSQEAILKITENIGGKVNLELPETLKEKLSSKTVKLLQDNNTKLVFGDHGFAKRLVIEKEDEGWGFVITPEEITELLYGYLSPKWVQLLKQEDGA